MSELRPGSGRLPLNLMLRLASRSLARHPWRTGLTLSSLALGLAALIFLGGLSEGWIHSMRDNFVLGMTGHLQIQPTAALGAVMDDPAPAAAALERDPAVVAWTPRLRAAGLASSAGRNQGIRLLALDPVRESEVTRLDRCLETGRFIRGGEEREVVLGRILVENLKLAVGDRVVLVAQLPGGEMASEVFHLTGVLCSSGPELDRWLALVPLAAAQSWLGTGAGVSQLVARVSGYDQVAAVAERVQGGLDPIRYQVRTWRDSDPMISQWLDFSAVYGLLLSGVVATLVLAQVVNTLLMSLYQRGPELGLMEALGTRPRQLRSLVLWEGVLITLLGNLLGLLLGLAVTAIFAGTGVDLTAFAGALELFQMDPVVYPRLRPELLARILGLVAAGAVLGTLYVAGRAARTLPSVALRRL